MNLLHLEVHQSCRLHHIACMSLKQGEYRLTSNKLLYCMLLHLYDIAAWQLLTIGTFCFVKLKQPCHTRHHLLFMRSQEFVEQLQQYFFFDFINGFHLASYFPTFICTSATCLSTFLTRFHIAEFFTFCRASITYVCTSCIQLFHKLAISG